ncbi:MAG TPA: DUF2269 family protein [Candidatus Cybelea sp.]|jgi:uncharacterized membrane protein|nr:DUF2269 family protein [Candidatus Cybelea sp.]
MYLIFKLVHVAGVVLFLGNITVGVFWKLFADRTRNAIVMATTVDGIIASDRIFTIPGILLLLIGGFGAAGIGKIPILSTGWLLWGLIAFFLSGVAFGPLSRTQRSLSRAAHGGNLEEYDRLSAGWNLWGTVALIFPVVAFILMILKPALPAF